MILKQDSFFDFMFKCQHWNGFIVELILLFHCSCPLFEETWSNFTALLKDQYLPISFLKDNPFRHHWSILIFKKKKKFVTKRTSNVFHTWNSSTLPWSLHEITNLKHFQIPFNEAFSRFSKDRSRTSCHFKNQENNMQ